MQPLLSPEVGADRDRLCIECARLVGSSICSWRDDKVETVHSAAPSPQALLHLERSAVTAATEVIHGIRLHLGGIDNFWCGCCSSLHRLNVPRPGAMAGLAGDSRNHLRKVEFAVRDGGCVVATKALLDPAKVQLSPQRLIHRTWNRGCLACRDIQAFHPTVITHPAFVVLPVMEV